MTIKPITRITPVPRSIYARLGSPIVISLLLLLPWVLWGAMKSAQGNNNNIRQWLPDDLAQTAMYDRFRASFGADEFAIVSWLNASLDDVRLDQFAIAIMRYTTAHGQDHRPSLLQRVAARIDSIFSVQAPGPPQASEKLFSEAISGRQAVRQLLDAPFDQKLSRDQALNRLQGILVGKDRSTSCVLLRLTDAGNRDRVATLRAILHATDQMGLPREEVRIGGEVVFNAMIDVESLAAIDQLAGLSGLAAILLAFLSLRSIRLTIMVFITALYTAGFAYATVHYTGAQMNLVLVVMPVLVYVTSIAGCIHLTNYYKDAVRHHGLSGAPIRAIRAAWLPCTLAAATTSVGLMSLAVSHIQPVRDFGLFGAWGVLSSLLFLFLLLPVMFERYPLRRLADVDGHPLPQTMSNERKTARWLRRMAHGILKARRYLLTLFAILFLIAAAGIIFTRTSVKASRFFPKQHKLVTDMKWLEDHIGPLVPIEIVIDFDNRANKLNMLERMELIAHVQQTLASINHVGGTISPASWAPAMEPPAPGRDAGNPSATDPPRRNPFALVGEVRRKLINAGLESNRQFFVDQHYLSAGTKDDDPATSERWRITGRFEAFNELAYDQVIEEVEARITGHLAALPAALKAGVTADFTGAVPLVHAAQQELLHGLFHSFIMAFVLICTTLSILLRGVRAGLIAMLPNIFPAIIIFGFMGWFGFMVDVGAMLTASVAMGIAVDGTLHYLTWFRRALSQGMTKNQALADAYARCAGALIQTTAITALSMLVFFSTTFQPVAQFGLLMCLMLVAAFIGTMLLLPAVLATRIGNLFVPAQADGAT